MPKKFTLGKRFAKGDVAFSYDSQVLVEKHCHDIKTASNCF